MTLRSDRLYAIQQTINVVLREHEGIMSTHYEGCWKHHAGCLAVVVDELAAGS